MILTDRTIIHAIQVGEVIIEPFNKDKLGPNSYDLTLSKYGKIYATGILDVKKHNKTISFEIGESGMILEPGKFYLFSTNEKAGSHNYVPMLEGKSSLARLGVTIHKTAGVGDVGFVGHWTLEVTVEKFIRIYPDMPVAQILFHTITEIPINPYNKREGSKYNNQSIQPVSSKMHENFD